jgi:hypothetical protein
MSGKHQGLGLAASLFLALGANATRADSLTPIAPYSGPDSAGSFTEFLGINNAGWTTGSIDLSNGDSLGFLRDPSGNYTTFAIGAITYGRAVSNTNTVVGYSGSCNCADGSEFTYTPATSTTAASTSILSNPVDGAPLVGIAQGINNSGAIVGSYGTTYLGTLVIHGFVLQGSTLTDIATPGDPYADTDARGIENNGTVVGWNINDTTGLQQGFVFSGGAFDTIINPNGLNGYGTILEAVNNNGLAIGDWYDAAGNSHAFTYNIATGAVTDFDIPGATYVTTWGINDNNQFVVTSDVGNFIYTIGGVAAPNGSAVFDPVSGANLPSGENEFAFNVTPGVTYYIDPQYADGFEYLAGTGPDFASVTAPTGVGLPTIFQLWLWNATTGRWVFDTDITGGVAFDFASPVSMFELRGIPTSAEVTSSNFITGLTFEGAGTFNGFQIALGVPEPATWTMLILGMLGLGAALRRRARGRVAA